jgi:hypothetical protein
MRARCFLIVLSMVVSTASYADSSADAKRDAALKGIDACLRRNEASSRECKTLNKNVETLTVVYRQGDRTVLPTLLRFTYLTEFFGETLVADPDGFLSAVSKLSEADQHSVAAGLAGGMFGLARPRFDAVRATLRNIPDSSPDYKLAAKCLATLETINALFLVDYFPPETFVGHYGDFQLRWFSREMYALEEKPLWPPVLDNETTYRMTIVSAFLGAESVTLTVLPDGTGRVRFQTTNVQHSPLDTGNLYTINTQQLANFSAALNRSNFWSSPTESSNSGFDGAEWILEGAQKDRYHVVVRWCPSKTPFRQVGRDLFDLAGRESPGGC